MDIQRVGTQGTLATGATQASQIRTTPRQPLDQLAQHHDEQSHNNACCIVRCFRRILACIVAIFRTLFGSEQTPTPIPTTPNTTTLDAQQPTQTAEPTPPQPATPVITKAQLQAQEKLEKGIDVEAVRKKIAVLMPIIKSKGENDEIVWHRSNNLVFSLKSVPNLVFKSAHPEGGSEINGKLCSAEQQIEHHFANMIKAQEVRTTHTLNLLVIPRAKKFKIDDMTFIAQERMTLEPDEAQEQLYKLPGLDGAIEHLAIFIAETGFNDVVWRNIPLAPARAQESLAKDLPKELLKNLPKRIALIDLEHMGHPPEGFYGSLKNRSCGLIGCLFSAEQIDKVLAVAKRYDINSPPFSNPKVERMKTIEEDQALDAFYKEKGILEDPGQRIVVPERDWATLGLNLDEQETVTITEVEKQESVTITKETEKQVTLREVAEYVIAEINKKITEKPFQGSVKAKRCILLKHKGGLLREYGELGLRGIPPFLDILTKEELMQKWPWRTINALVKHRYLFKLNKEDSGGYYIQA